MKISRITGFTFLMFIFFAANVKAQALASSQTSVLPPQPDLQSLVSFAAAKSTNSALISWKVKNESGNTVFGVEKSIDAGKTFQQIGTVQSNGSGIYGFADNNPATGQDQYRLKMLDNQGNSSYSNPLILLFQPMNVASNENSLYSNPINHSINQDVTGDDGLDMSPVSTQ